MHMSLANETDKFISLLSVHVEAAFVHDFSSETPRSFLLHPDTELK